MEKAKNHSQYVHKLLVLCKTWNRPAISIEELESILCQHPDSVEKIVKTELTYYKHTVHCSENIAASSLFKLNKISHEEKLSNLCILLNVFTTLKGALQVIQNNHQNQTTNSIDDELTIDIGQPCVTLWRENTIETWYVGYCIEVNDNVVTVEHIHQTEKCSNHKWKYPTKSDIAPFGNDQILDCEV